MTVPLISKMNWLDTFPSESVTSCWVFFPCSGRCVHAARSRCPWTHTSARLQQRATTERWYSGVYRATTMGGVRKLPWALPTYCKTYKTLGWSKSRHLSLQSWWKDKNFSLTHFFYLPFDFINDLTGNYGLTATYLIFFYYYSQHTKTAELC